MKNYASMRSLALMLALLASFFGGWLLGIRDGNVAMAGNDTTPGQYSDRTLPLHDISLLAEVLELVRVDYVDDISDQMLFENAVRGMVGGLDPHSAFLDVDEFRDIRISTSGNYTGIGLEVSLEDDVIKVVAPIDDTPAATAGLQAGDVIVMIDDKPLDQGDLQKTVRRLRGTPGTTVRLTVSRPGSNELLSFDLERKKIHVASVKHELVEDDIGYIRITQFTDSTTKDVRSAIKSLKRARRGSLRGFIIDLRNNPGGVLDAAVEISDLFLNEGLIVGADGRSYESQFGMYARDGDILDGAPIVVLVNGGSASASEIVAGALQDHQRALVLGAQTFGKGSVQTVLPLTSGDAVKLTTSKYFTPSGDSIHGVGITPDVEIKPDETDGLIAEDDEDIFIEQAVKRLRAS
ncbi:MAG: S41 family peptidase [Gammaproteobacteria bacterium]|nr:S41 family peptidase [Gammaproteobacteria bacterium]